jgi:PAS domain S-box-containing protein
MKNHDKTRNQLVNELLKLRQQIVEFKITEAQRKKAEDLLKEAMTECKQAYETMKESETRYRRLFETAQDGILILDADTGQITDVNPFLTEMLGYSHNEFLGKELWDIGPFKDVEAAKTAFKELQKKEYIRYEDLPLETKDGRPIKVEFVSNVYLVNGKKVIQCNIRNITLRVQAEEALRQSEAFNKSIIENSSDCIKVLDIDGRLQFMSHGGQQMLKIKDIGQYLNKSYDDFWRGSDYHAAKEAIAKARLGKIGKFSGYCPTADGIPKWWDVIISPIRDATGKVDRLMAISRDITERKQAEEKIQGLNSQLKQKVMELTEANKELDAFNHTVSHDLKLPLIIIGGFTRRFLKGHGNNLDTKDKNMLNAIQEHTQKMERLIKDLLVFSRVGRRKIKPADMDTGNLVTAVIEELKPLSEGGMVKYDIKTLPPAYGDQALIKQALINLLSNAIKFTTNKKTAIIEIGGWTEENENIYYVKDNGMGFNSQDSDKLFTVFQRLHGVEELEGSGVGLSIVQRIINKHGGRVWAEGKVNEGASFYFSLPNKISEDS